MLARVLAVRPGEGRTLALLGGHFFLLLAGLTLLATSAEAIFLAAHPYVWIAYTYLGGAALSVATSLAHGALSRRLGPAARARAVLGGAAAILVLLRLLLEAWPAGGAFAVMLAAPAFGVLVAMESADLVTRALDTRQARRLYPAVSGIGGIGATLGATAVTLLARPLGPPNLLWIAAGILLLPLPLALRVRGRHTRAIRAPAAPWRQVFTHRFPLLLVALVCLAGVLSTTVKFQLGAAVKTTLAPEDIAPFLGRLHAALNAVSIVFGPLVARRLVARLGVAASLVGYPLLMVLLGTAGFLVPGLAVASAALFSERLLRQNLQRPLLNIAMMPLPERLAARTAVAVRGAVETPAVALTSVTLLLVAPHVRWQSLSGLLLLAAVPALFAALALRRFYVRELVAALHTRRLALRGSDDTPWTLDASARVLLHEELRSESPERVALALRLLEGHAREESAARVAEAWPSWAPWLRARAVRTLAGSPAPAARAFLQGLGVDEAPEVRAARLGVPEVEVPREVLEDLVAGGSPQVAAAAALRLAGVDPEGRPPAAVEAWLQAPEAERRRAAVQVLVQAPRAETARWPALAQVAPDLVLEAAGARAAPELADVAAAALGRDETLAPARRALLRLGGAARPVLREAVGDPRRAAHALALLVELDEPAARTDVLGFVEAADEEQQARALRALLRRPAARVAGEVERLERMAERIHETCRACHACLGHREPAVAREARARLAHALERLFLVLALLEPGRPYRRIQLSLASGLESEHSFAVEALDELLPARWRGRLLPLLDADPARAPAAPDVPADPALARLAAALRDPGAHPDLARALAWQQRAPLDAMAVADLEALARAARDEPAGGPVLRFDAHGPRDLEAALLGEEPPGAPAPLDLPLGALWATLAARPQAAGDWLRGLAQRVAPAAPAPADVSLSGASLATRAAPGDLPVGEDTTLWSRLFTLRIVPFFAALPPARLRAVAEIARVLEVRPGEIVVREGRPAGHAYVVCRGRFEVRAPAGAVTSLQEGEAFGVFALLSGGARPARVTAAAAGEVLAIDRVDFQDLLAAHPGLVRSFSRLLAARARGAPSW